MIKLELPKVTGTHADVLAIAGAADVMKALKPRFSDTGVGFEIKFSREATLADVDDGPGFRYLKVAAKATTKSAAGKKRAAPVGGEIPAALVFDYATQSEKNKRLQAAKKTKDKDVTEMMAEDAPDPEFRSYRIVNVLQGDSGPNKLIEA